MNSWPKPLLALRDRENEGLELERENPKSETLLIRERERERGFFFGKKKRGIFRVYWGVEWGKKSS